MTRTILLADDDPAVRRMLCRVLAEEGYRVISVQGGEEAVEQSRHAPVDLVLLDLKLPLKNGWKTLQHLHGRTPPVPVIIITAQPNQIFPGLASNASAVMEKPLDLFKLLRLIDDLLVGLYPRNDRQLAPAR